MAPLSAIGIGTSWSLQGLWAAPWLRDVARLNRTSVVDHLSVMAFAVCTSALLLGPLTESLQRRGIKTEWVLASTLGLSMGAQAALLCGCPLPSYLPWSLIAAAGAATVLSFAILTEYFPKEMSGRANAALNLLHVGIAFLLQTGAGLIIGHWPQSDGTYPAEAHRTAMAILLTCEVTALGWFALASSGSRVAPFIGAPHPSRYDILSRNASFGVVFTWFPPANLHRRGTAGWPFAALCSAALCLSLVASLSQAISRSAVDVYLVRVHWPISVVDVRALGTSIDHDTVSPLLAVTRLSR
jgi:hypothetical protein